MSKTKWTICQDSICEGFSPITEDGEPVSFNTEEEAIKEIDSDPKFYEECFPCLMSEIGHKTILKQFFQDGFLN